MIYSDAIRIGNKILCGPNENLVLIAGPCVLEKPQIIHRIITECKRVCKQHEVQYIFKASFDKANRTSIYAERGPGIETGVEEFLRIKKEYEVPIVTDIHHPWHGDILAQCVDMIQIPAMLMRQTDLLKAAAITKLPILVKKQQSASPGSMRWVKEKLEFFGCNQMIFCERGSTFGYGRLVNDMVGLIEMAKLGIPVAFDATHSTQKSGDSSSGGSPEMVEPLARAATAIGISALFLETHPEPHNALSDGNCMLPLDELDNLIYVVSKIREILS